MWALPTKWRYWFWDCARTARIFLHEARQNALIGSSWWLEVKDGNENWYEGGHGQSNLVSHSTLNYGPIAPKRSYLQFMVLKGKDCNENAHEGGHGCCR